MKNFSFDNIVLREDTHAEKYDARVEKFGREDVTPMWVADMDLATSPAIQQALLERIKHPILGYTDYYSEYYFAIQRWMKKAHSWEIEQKWISPINSILAGLNMAIETFSNIGDGVIIQPPIYPPFQSMVKHHKRKVLENELLVENGAYKINFEEFEEQAKEAKIFLLCSPHNPTGRVWSKEELTQIVAICKKYKVLIISDEVHADLIYSKRHLPIGTIEEAEKITITLNAPSKSFNIAGVASAYAIIKNDSLRRKFHEAFQRYSLLNPNPLTLIATISAYTQSDMWLQELLIYLEKNLTYIRKRLEAMPKIKAMPTEATFLLWLDCSKLNLSDDELKDFFVNQAKMGLNQGSSFGKGGLGFMRLNFALPFEVLAEVMNGLEKAYKKNF